jgi:class 3 adenylate cyclase
MPNLIPHFVLDQFEQGRSSGTMEAAALLVDISGFTSLTETLLQHRKDGAEVLTEVLNRLLGPLVAEVYAHGGFVSTFAGDAFTALFPLDLPPSPASGGTGGAGQAHALQTAFFIQDFFAQHGRFETKYGRFAMSVKVGLAAGLVEWGILGAAGRHAYFFRGPALSACARAEQQADPGEIVADGTTLSPEGLQLCRTEAMGPYRRLLSPPPGDLPRFPSPPDMGREALAPFVVETAIDLVLSGASAEFRNVAAAFLSLEATTTPQELNAFVGAVLRLAGQYGGYYKDIDFGDKGPVLVCFFGAPVAHENDLQRAADFLLALQDEGLDLRWRAGLTYGTVYAGMIGGVERCEYTAIGSVINLAARLMMGAEWGEVLVPEAVAGQRRLRGEYLGDRRYKGISESLPTYRLLGRRDGEEALFEQRLVGRESELEKLLAAAQPVRAGRFAGVAYIYGEPGIGKSHLMYELRQALYRQAEIVRFTGQTDQVLRQAFNPFIYFLKRYFHQAPDAAPAENKARFEAQLEHLVEVLHEAKEPLAATADPPALAAELDRTRSVLGALLGLHWPGSLYESLDGNLRYQNTLFALKTLVLAECCFHPVVLEIEDLHWLDDSSHEALTTLSRNIADYPLLIVATSRYADDGSKPVLRLAEGTPSTAIDLNVLPPDALQRLAEHLLGGPVDDNLLALLLGRTQANPFFAQQFLAYFRENELLTCGEDGIWAVQESIPADVPTSINAILIARVDRLAQNVKDVVKAAAVLGREFDDRVLARMLEADISGEVQIAEREQIWSEVG